METDDMILYAMADAESRESLKHDGILWYSFANKSLLWVYYSERKQNKAAIPAVIIIFSLGILLVTNLLEDFKTPYLC